MNKINVLYNAISNYSHYVFSIISLLIILICIPMFKYKEKLVNLIAFSFLIQAVWNIYNHFIYGRLINHFKDDYVTQARIRIPSERCYWILLIIAKLLFILYPTIKFKSKAIIIYFPIRFLMIGLYLYFTNYIQKTAHGRSLTIGDDGSYNYNFTSTYQLEYLQRGGYVLFSIILVFILFKILYKNRDNEALIPKLYKYEIGVIIINALQFIIFIICYFVVAKRNDLIVLFESFIKILDMFIYILIPIAAIYILKQLKLSEKSKLVVEA